MTARRPFSALPRRLLLLAALLALAPGAPRAAVPADGPCQPATPGGPQGEGKGEAVCAPAPAPPQAFALEAPSAAEARSDTDVTHYALDVEILPEYDQGMVVAVGVAGTSTIEFAPTVDGLTRFTVDLQASLTATGVSGDVASWSRVGDAIQITLDRPYDTGEPVRVAIAYQGHPQDAGYGAFRWWLRNGQLVVATLSEPFFAHYWWPCKDALGDKATLEMRVTVPSPLVALSNGVELGSEALPGGRTRTLWQETRPMIPYLASLAVSSYERYELAWAWDDGGVPASLSVPCYLYPDHWDPLAGEPLPDWKAGCDGLLDMLTTFSVLFGPYPFLGEKYGVVETGGPGGLAANMEHQTLSSMFRIDSYANILAHELAHQWWGDEVSTATWNDIWLNEGFASYAEALYLEFRSTGSTRTYWNRMKSLRPVDPDAQVYRTSTATVADIFSTNDVYNKGAWVLHMLRHVLGDAAFFGFLASYRAQFADDSVTTAGFSAALSASFGHDLSWFVDEWVLNPGSPDYEWAWETETLDGRTWLELAVWQRQDADGFGLFRMPLDVVVTTAEGTTTRRIWNDDWLEHYVLPLDGAPLAVALDADGGTADRNWVLWDSLTPVATPLAPPPVLLATEVVAPSPGAPVSVALTFSQDVGSFDASDVELVGATSGVQVPSGASYDPAAQRATLTWDTLPADAFDLVVFAAGVSANGQALDGETDTAAWWDDQLLPSGDGQPGGDAMIHFRPYPECGDGIDNDGDGYVDYPTDPGCRTLDSSRERSACQDGVDNDGTDGTDFDGGESILGVGHGDPAGPDPKCRASWSAAEAPACGLGHELALGVGLAALLRRRRLRAPKPVRKGSLGRW